MSTGEALQAIECPKGSHLLREPVILPCYHILCTSCYKHASSDRTSVRCPFSGCSKSFQADQVRQVPVIKTTPGVRCQNAAAGVYPGSEPHDGGKAMEKDLLGFENESVQNKWEGITFTEEKLNQVEHEGAICNAAMAGTQISQQKDSYDFQYVKLSNTFKPPAERKRDNTWDIKTISDRLSKVIEDNEFVIGFYESYEKDKIYIDIEKGHLKPIETLIEEKFHKEWENKRFEIVEQDNVPEFYIATGAKIIASKESIEPLIGGHPDDLKEYGTVTCLGIDARNKAYIITVKHVFNEENRQQDDVEGRYLSSFDSKITPISTKFSGYLGGYEVQDRQTPVQVDVAALPLDQNIVDKFDSTLRHKLNRCYTGSDDGLEGVVVNKRGATTGYTSGHILRGNYTLRRPGQKTITGSHFLIAPSESYQQFSKKGDSGSLIWSAAESSNGCPIGIISMGYPNHFFMGRMQNTTLAVRLDHCLEAMREHLSIDIKVCEAYDAPLPLALPTVPQQLAVFQIPEQEQSGAEGRPILEMH